MGGSNDHYWYGPMLAKNNGRDIKLTAKKQRYNPIQTLTIKYTRTETLCCDNANMRMLSG